jgi:hypothetical protein
MNLTCKLILLLINLINQVNSNTIKDGEYNDSDLKSSYTYSIEGKVFPFGDEPIDAKWLTSTRVIVNYGQYLGFIK